MIKQFLLALVFAGPAWADYTAGNFTQAQTRFGALQIAGDLGSQRILFNGTDLGVTNHAFHIEGVWAVDGGAQDWAILFSRHGGNMCGGGDYMAIMLTETAAVRTDEFGTCRARAIDVRVSADALELDVSDEAPLVSHNVFRFDGKNLTKTPVAVAAAPAAGLGADITRWLQHHPQALTQDPSEQARFARIMTPAQMDEMNSRMSGPGGTEQQGDWIVGSACQAHSCGSRGAAWALRITDGAVLAVFYDGPRVAQALTGDQHLSGPVVAQLLAGR